MGETDCLWGLQLHWCRLVSLFGFWQPYFLVSYNEVGVGVLRSEFPLLISLL